MPVEIEKKYRISKQQREHIVRRLRALKAKPAREEFEENTLYRGGVIDWGRRVLRLRRVGSRAILTFKERAPTNSAIKHQDEEETEISNPEALDSILDSLGFLPALVYEKRRTRWELGPAEIVLDELPFGLFMEIEASESEILRLEAELGATKYRAELATYPRLTAKFGKKRGEIIESRFPRSRSRDGKPGRARK
jgi:predicted adenylyl cyclase CyaB